MERSAIRVRDVREQAPREVSDIAVNDDDRGPHGDQIALALSEARGAPAEARAQVGRWVRSLDVHPALHRDILLAVSELVTNALVHAGAVPSVSIGVAGDVIRLEVRDPSVQPPVQRAAGGADGGFGLRLVDAVSDSWGYDPVEGGKVVWAQFDLSRSTSPLTRDGTG